MEVMHSLLKRQLRRHFGDQFSIPAQWRPFIDRVNDAYLESDADRAMLEHSLELSSQELLDANAEMRAVFQAIPDLVFRINHEGIVLDIKAGSPGDMMVRREALIGKRVQDIPLENVAKGFSEAIGQVIGSGSPVSIEYSAVLHGQESHYEARLAPLPDKQIAVVVRNITERKQSLRLLGSAVEQATESILITDAQLERPGPRILFVNPAFTRTTGYTAAEAVGQTPRILQGPKSDRATLDQLRETLRQGETFSGQTINYRKDGTEFQVEMRIAPIRNSSGVITHFLGTQHDITERTRTQAELEAASKALVESSRQAGMAEIATNVLHNVGNILNSVNVSAAMVSGALRSSRARGLSQAIRLMDEHAPDLGDFLTRDEKGKMLPGYLVQSAQALAQEQQRMIEELANLTQSIDHIKAVVATQQSYARRVSLVEPTQMGELAEDALRINGDALARHGIAVLRQFAPVPVARLDRARVLQILVNLVRNASNALESTTDQPRQITMTVDATADARLRVAVKDNGEGIPAENLTRIFVNGFTTRKTGHGFGLHSCALAAGQMGGTLAASSDGPGRGAVFTLELPLDGDQATP